MALSHKAFLDAARLRRAGDKKGSYILTFLEHSIPITSSQIRCRRDFLGIFWDGGIEAPNVPPLGPRYDDFASALMAKLYCKVQGEHSMAVMDKLLEASPSTNREDLLIGHMLALRGKMHLYPAPLLRAARAVDPAVTTHDVSYVMREMGWYKSSVRIGKDTYGTWTREQTNEESDRFAFDPITDLRAPEALDNPDFED